MEKDQAKHLKYIKIYWIIVISGIVSLIAIFTLISNGKFNIHMPDFYELENPNTIVATRVFSSDSVELGVYFQRDNNRALVNYPDISPNMVNALIAIEDARYWRHSGIDIKGLARVAFKTLLMMDRSAGGGSTITQQLAKNIYGREPNVKGLALVKRKLVEWVIAVKLERSFTKEEIIAMYLNKVSFVNNAQGIKSAAHVYFNTTQSKLSIEQSAMLAGMHQNPTTFNPKKRPEGAKKRRNIVLKKMLDYDYITKEIYDSVKTTELGLDFQRVDHKLGMAAYFREYLRGIMTQIPGKYGFVQYEWDNNPLYGWCAKTIKPDGTPYNIYKDGLRIYTTIHSKIQKYAEEAVRQHIGDSLQKQFERELKGRKNPPYPSIENNDDIDEESIENNIQHAWKKSEIYRIYTKAGTSEDSLEVVLHTPREMSLFAWNEDGYIDTMMTPYDSIKYIKSFLRSGLISMVPQTGHVKAYVGGINYVKFQYDQINQGTNQVGSIFKPFLYTLAYENGHSPCTEVLNIGISFPHITPEGEKTTYTPKFSSTSFDEQWIPLRLGLAKSLNQTSAWIMEQYNPEAVIEIAKKMGVRSELDPVPSLCLGVSDLKLSEITRAFSTFANKGFYIEPIYVTRIEDKNGNVIANFSSTKKEAISEITAYKMLKTMEGVSSLQNISGNSASFGTGAWLRNRFDFDFPIAGKTGTTNDNADGWFVGITPDLITGVWAGGEDRKIRFKSNILGQGANMALPVYGFLMQKILADSTINISLEEFEAPEGYDYEKECNEIKAKEARKRSRTNEEIF